MSKHEDSINIYIAAWNEASSKSLMRQLQACSTPDVSYSDPFTRPHAGIEKLAQTIIGFQQSFPDTVHALSGNPLFNEGDASYIWSATLNNGKIITGIDYLEFTPRGLISRVISFSGKNDWQ